MKNKLFLSTFILAIISAVIIYLQFGEINRDGVVYLSQAQTLIEGSWNYILEDQWPFFGIFIYLFHNATNISILYSAHLIDVFCFLVASFFFLKNIQFISRGKVSPFYGLTILLTSIPIMDDYLGMILRDHGQWTGYMFGLYAYLRWIEKKTWAWALLWQCGFLFGALFRLESILFITTLPLMHQLFMNPKKRLETFFQSISLLLIGVIFIFCFYKFNLFNFNNINVGRLEEIFIRPKIFINNFLQPLELTSNIYYLNVLLTDFGFSFKYFFLSYIGLYKWIAGLGFLHLGLFFLALKFQLIEKNYLKVLFIFLFLSSLITLINLYTTYVISSRYLVLNWWIVYIFSAFGLNYFSNFIISIKKPFTLLIRVLFFCILLIYFLNVLIDKSGNHFEYDAAKWVKKKNIDINNIYFNTLRTAYYLGFFNISPVNFNYATEIIQYDYLMISYNRFEKIKTIINYEPIKYFPSIEKPKLIIYKRLVIE